jgi:hypothetical protein
MIICIAVKLLVEMATKPAAVVPTPRALSLSQAIQAHESLAGLMARVAGSKRRYEAILPLLPPGLCPDVRPGALDDEHWSLLAANAAAAAKLRQILPTLQAALAEAGYPAPAVKVKVVAAPTPGPAGTPGRRS